WACHQSILDIRYYLVHPYDTCDCYERLCSYYDVEGGTMSTKRNQRTQRIPDISALKVKPHWYNELHKPIAIIGHKMPYGIQCSVEHDGVQYDGMLYPVVSATKGENET